MNTMYELFLDQDKEDPHFSASCTVVAAEHLYACQCPSCYVHWVHIYGPAELEDSEFGPFGRKLLDEGRAYLGLPKIIEGQCFVCDIPTTGYEGSPMACEEHYEEL